MWTLWQWLPTKDEWLWLTESETALKRKVLSHFKRRNPGRTKFKWKLTSEGRPKRFRKRT